MSPDEAHIRAVADRWLDLIQNDAEYPDKICTDDYRAKFYPSDVEMNGIGELRAGVKDTFAATGPRTFQLAWAAVSASQTWSTAMRPSGSWPTSISSTPKRCRSCHG